MEGSQQVSHLTSLLVDQVRLDRKLCENLKITIRRARQGLHRPRSRKDPFKNYFIIGDTKKKGTWGSGKFGRARALKNFPFKIGLKRRISQILAPARTRRYGNALGVSLLKGRI